MPYDDLRTFMEKLRDESDLLEIDTPVDPKFEVAAYIRKTSDTAGPAVLLKTIPGYATPILGGLFAARRRALWGYGATNEDALHRYVQAFQNPRKPRLSETGPSQEVVLTGDQIDVSRFPNPVYSELDAGHYITMGVLVSKDPETGVRNAGIYRLQVKSKGRLGLFASERQHVALHLAKAEAQGKPLEVAVAVGTDPTVMLAAAAKPPYGFDEFDLAGGLRSAPLNLIRCRTVNLEVPATSEIVLEGRIPPKVREMEGPFGEVTGYYGDAAPRPIIELTAITHREEPIYLAGLTGMPTTDNHILKEVSYNATYYEELRRAYPEVKGVHFPSAGGTRNIMFIALKPRYDGEARAVLLAAFGLAARPKMVVTVDPDINIHDPEQVLWAIAFRSQPAQDVLIADHLPGYALDPSLEKDRLSSSLGIDATTPVDHLFPPIVRSGNEEIIAEGLVEDKRVLRDESENLPNPLPTDMVERFPIKIDRSLGRFQQPEHKMKERRLPRAALTDDGGELPFANLEADSVENAPSSQFQRHVLEPDRMKWPVRIRFAVAVGLESLDRVMLEVFGFED